MFEEELELGKGSAVETLGVRIECPAALAVPIPLLTTSNKF